ncbi:MAG: NADH-quinone oxidoreductase subunit N [Cytophagales bacterium]|nr:MAG: NADH-quinone oxidoreductase subunit N [Cytophagales bacterium]
MSYSDYISSFPLESIAYSLKFFLTEITLSIGFVLLILSDLFLSASNKKWLWWQAMFGFVIVLILTISEHPPINQALFFGQIVYRASTQFFQLFFIIPIITVLIYQYFRGISTYTYTTKGEYYSFLFALLLGLNLMLKSNNFIMLFLSIEMVSIISYLLVAIEQKRKNLESSIKYLIFGAVSSSIMLYGISWYYGLTGTFQFQSLPMIHLGVMSIVVFFIVAGALFKLSIFPFHTWVPDVYEGTSSPILALLSLLPKVAGITIFCTILSHLVPNNILNSSEWIWKGLLLMVSLSILIGNFSALLQENTKRMLAYSSIAHAGFLLIAILTPQVVIGEILMVYLVAYFFANTAIFLIVDSLDTGHDGIKFEAYKGLGLKKPLLGILITIVLLSLSGLPPTIGFSAKFLVFAQLYKSYQQTADIFLLWMLIFIVLNTLISLFYYLKIPYYLFFKNIENKQTTEQLNLNYWFFSILIFPLILLFFMPQILVNLINFIQQVKL